jgi:hypothetical protein
LFIGGSVFASAITGYTLNLLQSLGGSRAVNGLLS